MRLVNKERKTATFAVTPGKEINKAVIGRETKWI
jgi:hypothetical protein